MLLISDLELEHKFHIGGFLMEQPIFSSKQLQIRNVLPSFINVHTIVMHLPNVM